MKKLLIMAVIAAVAICGGCKKSQNAGTSDPTGETEETGAAGTEMTSVPEGDPVETKLEKLWRLDLPELGEHQTLHDDRVRDYVVYFPDSFVISEEADEDDDTITFASETDGASLTVTAEDNGDKISLEDYSEELKGKYPIAEINKTGEFGLTVTGAKEGGNPVIIKAVVTEGIIYKAVLSFPQMQAEKYALPENEILLMVVGLDKNGDAVEYNTK